MLACSHFQQGRSFCNQSAKEHVVEFVDVDSFVVDCQGCVSLRVENTRKANNQASLLRDNTSVIGLLIHAE